MDPQLIDSQLTLETAYLNTSRCRFHRVISGWILNSLKQIFLSDILSNKSRSVRIQSRHILVLSGLNLSRHSLKKRKCRSLQILSSKEYHFRDERIPREQRNQRIGNQSGDVDNHFHKHNLRHLPRFPDFFVTFRILSPVQDSLSNHW